MRRMKTASPAARLALLTTMLAMACGGQSKAPPAPPAPGKARASNMPTPAPPMPGKGATVSAKADMAEFDYSWPQEAADIPALDGWLRGNAEGLRKRTFEGARREAAAAKRNGYMLNGWSYEEHWRTVANLPALLVLQSEGYVYTNGAHGMPIVTTLFWDRARRTRLATNALFDLPALKRAINARFCKALDAQRESKRGEPVNPRDADQIPEFVQCIDPMLQTVLPVSKQGKALDTVRVVVMPYEAGPYSEGIYQIDLPVDAAVLGAVKPAYRGAFAAGR